MISFLIFALIVLVVAYILIRVIALVPGLEPPIVQIANLIIGLVALLAILERGLPLLGMGRLL